VLTRTRPIEALFDSAIPFVNFISIVARPRSGSRGWCAPRVRCSQSRRRRNRRRLELLCRLRRPALRSLFHSARRTSPRAVVAQPITWSVSREAMSSGARTATTSRIQLAPIGGHERQRGGRCAPRASKNLADRRVPREPRTLGERRVVPSQRHRCDRESAVVAVDPSGRAGQLHHGEPGVETLPASRPRVIESGSELAAAAATASPTNLQNDPHEEA